MSLRWMPFLLAVFLLACARIEVPPGGPPDQQGPTLHLLNPSAGACNQPSDLVLELEFSEYVDRGATLKALRLSPELPNGFQAKWRGKRLFLHPRTPFPENRSYTFEIGPGCRDFQGNPLIEPFRFSFSTGPTLDSLEIQGRLAASTRSSQCLLWKAEDPNAITYSDPTWRTYPDSKGMFAFRALPEGNYRLLAQDGETLFGSALALPSSFVQSMVPSKAETEPVLMRLSHEPFVDSLSLEAMRWTEPNTLALRAIVEPALLAPLRAHERADSTGNDLRRSILWISTSDHSPTHPTSYSKSGSYISLTLPFDGDSTTLFLWMDGLQDTLQVQNAPIRVDSLTQEDSLSHQDLLGEDESFAQDEPKEIDDTRTSKKSEAVGALLWNLDRLPEDPHWRLVLLTPDEEFEHPLLDQGTFSSLPEGRWSLASYLDKNGNMQWDEGCLSPFRHAEPWLMWPDTLDVIANWTREGIDLKLPKEIQ